MRTTIASAGTRLLLVAGAVGGGLAGAGTASSRSVGAATEAACSGRLPGSGARCDTDRFVATTGPFLTPTVVGVVLGVLAVAVVLLVLRAVARAVRRGGAPPVDGGDGPAWRPVTVTVPSAASETRSVRERSHVP